MNRMVCSARFLIAITNKRDKIQNQSLYFVLNLLFFILQDESRCRDTQMLITTLSITVFAMRLFKNTQTLTQTTNDRY